MMDQKKASKFNPFAKKSKDMADAVKSNEKIRLMDDHKITLEELQERMDTDILGLTGLTQDKASDLLSKNGPNQLTEKKGLPWYCVFLKEMTGFFSLLLWFGAFLCFIGFALDSSDNSNLWLGIVLSVVTFVTGCFSYYQSSKSAALMAQFKNFIPPRAAVVRDGTESIIEATKLVVGDIVKVKGGDNIPADIRIVESNEMKVNNASLTGESEDLIRKTDNTADNPLETANLAFFGTQCTVGTGTGVVINTGDNSVIGQIASLAQAAQTTQTPLSIEIHRFIRIVSGVAIFLGVTFFILGIIYGYDIITNLVFMIGIIVANVPEGLLATVTVSLALTAKRMAKKKVLVKNLESVETLGSTSCICSDKTGTLTQNVMTVSHLWYDGDMHDASVNYQQKLKNKDLDIDYDLNDPSFSFFIRTIVLSTKAFFEFTPTEEQVKRTIGKKLKKSGKKVKDSEVNTHKIWAEEELLKKEQNKDFQQRQTAGDASESGLVKFCQPCMDLDSTRDKYPLHTYKSLNENNEEVTVKCEVPFNSFKKYNVVIRDMSNNKEEGVDKSRYLLILKGAPERIWGRCSHILVKGELEEIDDMWQERYKDANRELGDQGERVLAFSYMWLSPDEYPAEKAFDMDEDSGDYPMENLIFCGLMSLNDPPRMYVDHSVEKCRRAGIKVIMVTGDQPVTAAAIAKKVKIITRNEGGAYKVNVDLKEQHPEWTEEKLLSECTSVVVHGDELAIKHSAEEELDDKDPEKGRFLLNWINKPEVVFARTTPSQKLLIVDGCQKAGHVVAVTGDGVNDSPAIKKANIGIAMGSGSDVAKNAADMILLDDDFSSIVNGVEEGRLIFDNLKKSIAYTLSSNIPEISPFIMFILAQVPLPLTTVLILCIDLGTDMVPAISMAYENPELDIMQRAPRNSKRDHLVNSKMISFSYLQIGMVQAAAGFYTYFVVMSDYGFKPATLFQLQGKIGVDGGDLEWNQTTKNKVDARHFYSNIYPDAKEAFVKCRFRTSDPWYYWKSFVSDEPICYTTEALRYAQSAYLVSIVCVQWADLMICKTRNLSISQQGMVNWIMDFGLFFETFLVAFLCYVPWLNIPLGTRMLASPHFAIPSFPFFTVIFFYDECRKMILRSGISEEGRYTGWVIRNTYY